MRKITLWDVNQEMTQTYVILFKYSANLLTGENDEQKPNNNFDIYGFPICL